MYSTKMIQNKFIILVIFITIYTKSIYSNPASFNSLNEQYDTNNQKHLVGSGVIGRAFSNIYETVFKKQGKSLENDALKNVATKINYDPFTRKFFIENNSQVSAASVHRTGRKIITKKRGYIWDGVFDFMRGGFFDEFSGDKGRKPPNGENSKKTPIPLKDNSKSEEESDDDPLDNFLDGLDDMFSGSSKKKPVVSAIARPNKAKPKPSLQSSESSEGFFSWLTGSDYDDDDEDDSPEKINNKVTSSNVVQPIYSTTTSTTDYYENTMQYSTVNEEYYEPTEDISSTLFADYETTLPVEDFTMEQNDEFGTTLYEVPVTPATTKSTTPKIPTRLTAKTTLTTSTTSKPVTRKPTTVIIRRITTKIPYRRPTISYSQFVNTKTKPTKRVTSNRPYSLTNVLPMTSSMKPHVYTIPVTVPKETIVKKDCVEKKPGSFGTITWFPQIFGTSNKVTSDGSISATKPAGWLSYFSSDYADDPEEVTEAPSSAVSWFGSFFTEETSTKAPDTIISSSTVEPTITPPPAVSWFDTFLDTEEDDGAYANNATVQPVKKSRRKSYKGFQLLRLHPDVSWKVEDLKDLKDDTKDTEVMWWSTPSVNKSADLLIPADMLPEIKSHLNAIGTAYDVLIWDLQKAITYENPKLSKKQRLELEKTRGHPLTWRRYHRYADILRYMEYLSLKYPDIVELVPLGRSSEGLPIVAAKLTFPLNGSSTPTVYKKKWKLKSKMKPAIWIDGGMHAREWISPAVATWLLHTLVEGEHGNGAEMEMLKIADWYILPVANPDGYEHTHTTDRLWKKTRSNQSKKDENEYFYNSWFPWNWAKPLVKECFGTDLNRNWDYHWGEKGSSKDPCSDYYAGPRAFSEPETLAISNFLIENKEQMKVYLSLHSYDQMWVVPTTHTSTPFPDSADLMEMGKLALSALSDVYGTKYKIGSLDELLHPVSGAAHDWAKGQAGIKYSYAIKMRDSYGPYGFLLPGSQITPTAKETWEAIKTIADNL